MVRQPGMALAGESREQYRVGELILDRWVILISIVLILVCELLPQDRVP
jgi:hypothetical protein